MDSVACRFQRRRLLMLEIAIQLVGCVKKRHSSIVTLLLLFLMCISVQWVVGALLLDWQTKRDTFRNLVLVLLVRCRQYYYGDSIDPSI